MDRPLRIVLAMVEPPLPLGHASARWYSVLLRGLVERGHDVTAFATCSREEDVARAEALFPSPLYDLRCHLHPARGGLRSKWQTLRRPLSHKFGAELHRDLGRELARGYDVLHLEQLSAGWLGWDHPARALVNVHHLLGIDLAEVGRSLEKTMLLRGEDRLLRRFRHFRTLSPRLTDAVRRSRPWARVETVPLGFDVLSYPFVPDGNRPLNPVVTLIASMGWYPGRSAAERLLTRLWPTIRRRLPSARLRIVGWGAEAALERFAGEPGVEILGDVPDIRPFFEDAGVLLYAPARGSGMKVKVLESFAFGLPVVTTGEGVEGLPAVDGVHAGVCEDDAGLVDRTVELLESRELQDRQRRAARTLVEEHCAPERAVDAIEALYHRVGAAA